MGYDAVVTDFGALGLSFSYNIADIKLNGSGENRVAMENLQIGIYDGIWFNDFFIESQASVGFLNFESERDIVFDDFTRSANADFKGMQYAGNLKAGYKFKTGKISITPTVALNYNKYKLDAYTETDAGFGVNLNVDEINVKSVSSDLMLELAHTTEINVGDRVEATMRFDLHGGWSKEFENNPVSMTARFAGFDDTFSLIGGPILPSSYQVGAGFYFTSGFTSFGIKYDARLRNGYSGHSATVNFRVRF
jgi:outer membrane autotransporter protein